MHNGLSKQEQELRDYMAPQEMERDLAGELEHYAATVAQGLEERGLDDVATVAKFIVIVVELIAKGHKHEILVE